ncbi:hypothetical protein A6R68_00270, partial [Neotoma lepida]
LTDYQHKSVIGISQTFKTKKQKVNLRETVRNTTKHPSNDDCIEIVETADPVKSLDIIKSWNLTCDVCHKEYIKLYDKLGSSYLLDRERESFYPDRMNEICKRFLMTYSSLFPVSTFVAGNYFHSMLMAAIMGRKTNMPG